MEDESGLQQISWYHGELSRHQAEALLMSNGMPGSYLLRKSHESGQLAVSVKCQDSVKHFRVECSAGRIKFGFSEFQSLQELLAHFSQKPLVGSETGTLVVLQLPYPRLVSEPQTYESVRIHTALHGETDRLEPHAVSLATKEGYLTKQGSIVKNWKLRWFTVSRHEMKYYKEPKDTEAIKTLDLTKCTGVHYDYTQDRRNVFCLVFPERTYFMYADSPRETDEWVRLLRWKLVKPLQSRRMQDKVAVGEQLAQDVLTRFIHRRKPEHSEKAQIPEQGGSILFRTDRTDGDKSTVYRQILLANKSAVANHLS